LTNPRFQRKLFERPNVVMTSPNTHMSLQRIGGGRTRVNFIRGNSNHSPIRIQEKVHSWVNQVGEWIIKIFHLKVEIN
jgi:hypothetical protein